MHFTHFFGLFLATLLALPTWAQTGKISGTVLDREGQSPLEFSTVSVFAADSSLAGGAITNTEGLFEVKGLPEGTYRVVIGFLGYQPQTISPVALAKNQHLILGKIELGASEALLNEIEVKGEKAASYHQIDRQVYRADQFRNSQGGSAIDVLRNMPAVSVTAEGELSMRGATGFMVLLNGKPVQSDPATLLAQIPANSIEDIEIITSPSAKYDPDGKGGIIHIKTKRGADDGLYLLVNALVGLPSVEDYGNPDPHRRYGGDFTLNFKQNKWEFSLGADYKRDDLAGQRIGEVATYLGDTTTLFPSAGERSFDRYNYSGRANISYAPNARNTFTAGFFAGERRQLRTADILYNQRRFLTSTGQNIDQLTYFNANLVERTGDFFIGSLDYSHQFADKSTLTVSGLYEYTQLGGPTRNINLRFPETLDTLQHQRNENDNPLDGARLNVDYAANWGGLKWEMGYQFRYLLHVGEFTYLERTLGTNDFVVDPRFSNRVDLERHIHSAYAQAAGKSGKWDYVFGLRGEYADRELRTGQRAEPYVLRLRNLFPSANLQYRLSDTWRLKAAYSRRIDRTTTFKMNPFPEREHSETLEQGDAELLPEFTNAIEAGMVKDFGDNSLFFNVYYRRTRDVINRVNTVFNDTILNRIYTNAGVAHTTGLELGADLKPTKWWKVFFGGNVYRYQIEGDLFNDPINTANTVFSFNASTTVTPSPTWSIQWNLNYLSARITAQGEDSRFYTPNLTVRKTLLDGRLSATFQWLNMDLGLLRTNEQRISTWRNNFFTTTNYIHEVDILLLNFSYQLNSSSKKVKFIKSEFGDKEF